MVLIFTTMANLPVRYDPLSVSDRLRLAKKDTSFAWWDMVGAVAAGAAGLSGGWPLVAVAALGGAVVSWTGRFGWHFVTGRRKVAESTATKALQELAIVQGELVELKSGRPQIDVTETRENGLHETFLCLDVMNARVTGNFIAQIKVLEGSNQIRKDHRYFGCWDGTAIRKAILPGQIERLRLGRITRPTGPVLIFTIELTECFDLQGAMPRWHSSMAWALGADPPMPRPSVLILVTITSEPPMEEPWIAVYRVDLDGLTRMAAQDNEEEG